jgi:thymidylate synthase ThyX
VNTQAEVKLDSISPDGVRLTTFEVTYPRFIHSEFMTHRVFSRNSASSRAIPVAKQLAKIKEDPALPTEFGTNQPGMQAGPPLEGALQRSAFGIWDEAALSAASYAEKLQRLDVHKQVTNRILEPFMWHTVIVTAVDYENFFNQRCSPLAQPEIEELADCMSNAYKLSNPTLLEVGQWHTPYLQEDELSIPLGVRLMVSAARCARVSYLTQAGVRDYHEDVNLFHRLATADPPHWSPMEHVASPYSYACGLSPRGNFIEFVDDSGVWEPTGWAQLRHNMGVLDALV